MSEVKNNGLLEQAYKANIGNILKKAKSGKVLTEREMELLEEYEAEKLTATSTNKKDSLMIFPPDVVTQFFGVTPMTLTNWGRMGMPKRGRGSYNLKEIFKWWLENIHKSKDVSAGEVDTRERYWTAKADNEELKRDHTKGKLISKDRVVREFAARAVDLKVTMRAFKFRIAPLLEGKSREEITQILSTDVDRLLEAFCRNGRYIGVLEEDINKKPKAKKKAAKKK